MSSRNAEERTMSTENHNQPTEPLFTAEQTPMFTPGQQFATPPAPKKHRPWVAIAIATAAVIGIGGLGTAAVAVLTTPKTSAASTTTPKQRGTFGQYGQGGFGSAQGDGQGAYGYGSGGSSASTQSPAVASTAAEKVGVVTINTELNYTSSDQAAGTGMIISSNGLILTNNHVVEDSTSISVTVESTGKAYTASVVGTDATADVAVLKLQGASGLKTVDFNASEKVAVGQAIHSVGNAEGTGDLVTATGTVKAVNQNLTVGSDYSTEGESLTGLIELDSDVVSGDSGGPLFDKSGDVIGIVTAASSGSANVTGYAINIAQVLKVAQSIEAGEASSDIVIGTPAFLGVDLGTDTTVSGVPISGVIAGMPADVAGITEGSVITAVNGQTVASASDLSAIIHAQKVGSKVTIAWTDADGAAQSATVTLVAGPAA
jgi:S1-C subfamily serine protease